MAIKSVQYGDTGTVLRLLVYRADGETVESLLGSANTLTIYLKPPSGTTKIKTAALTTDGSDGKMEYATISGDLNESGIWQIQGGISWSGVGTWRTQVRPFMVEANL